MKKLGRPTGHRLSLIRNLMTDLIRYERLRQHGLLTEDAEGEGGGVAVSARRDDDDDDLPTFDRMDDDDEE